MSTVGSGAKRTVASILGGQPLLAGSFEKGSDGNLGVEFFIPNWPRFPEIAASAPTDRVMLFLRRQPDMTSPLYRIVNIDEGYYVDDQGVEPPYGATDPWVTDLHGLPFSNLVDQVRAAATSK